MLTIDGIRDKLFQVLQDTPVKKAILFGSYAKGAADKTSDIDLVIDSLGRLNGIDFFGVVETIVQSFDIPLDIIEASQIAKNSKIYDEIQRTGITVYERYN